MVPEQHRRHRAHHGQRQPQAIRYTFSELASLAGLAEGGSYEILFTPIDSEGNRGLWETRTVDIQTTDSDGDGVPDQWEITYGFDPNDPADLLANNDFEQDGVSDKDEFLNGSNPKLADSDEDGISDKIEINLRSLGLDPAVANPGLASLVNDSLTDGFNLTDLRRLKPGAPILLRDPDTGKFVMTVDVKESPDLTSGFTPLPLTTENVSLTPAGNIEVEITPAPGDTKAFYRIEINE